MTAHHQSAQADLLSRAQFQPVFDENGEFVDVYHVKVSTDVRLGIKAMRELLDSSETHDELVLPTGFTAKQSRILATPAPMTAHYLKPSRRWDASLGEFVPKVTIKLPYEVVWVLFETLFAGQFSVKIEEVSCVTEDVVPAPAVEGVKTDDAPGRLFFAQARVTLSLHLPNGQTRSYEGLGISYDNVRVEKSGNVWALNSSRRMAEKGAIADAKREALANLGPVFRLAFEDGDEMIEKIEQKLAEKLTEHNPRPAAAGGSTSAAPRRPTRKATGPVSDATADAPAPTANRGPNGDIPEGYVPYEAEVELRNAEKAAGQADGATPVAAAETDTTADRDETETAAPALPDAIADEAGAQAGEDQLDVEAIQDTILACESFAAASAMLAERREDLARLDPTGNAFVEIEAMVKEAFGDDDGLPDFAAAPVKAAIDPAWVIDAEGKTSTAVLRAYIGLFKKARTVSDLDAIIEANKAAARRLNPTHMVEMANAKETRRASLG